MSFALLEKRGAKKILKRYFSPKWKEINYNDTPNWIRKKANKLDSKAKINQVYYLNGNNFKYKVWFKQGIFQGTNLNAHYYKRRKKEWD